MQFEKFGGLIGSTTLIVSGIESAQAEIKVSIAGPLSGGTLDVGEQQDIDAQKAIDQRGRLYAGRVSGFA